MRNADEKRKSWIRLPVGSDPNAKIKLAINGPLLN